ncbi:hypothetical protein Tco_1263356 [Tanacetum coccineum]
MLKVKGGQVENVDEDKEIDEVRLSTEDAVSTNKEGVSTDFEKVSTDFEKVSTDKPKVSTDEQIEGTEEHNEGSEEIFESTEEQREGTEEKVESTAGQREEKVPCSKRNRRGNQKQTSNSESIKKSDDDLLNACGDFKTLLKSRKESIEEVKEEIKMKRTTGKEKHAPDEEKEVDYEILDKKYPIIDRKTEYLGTKPQFDESKRLEEINLNVVTRSNGQKRYFSTLMRVLSVFDREDLDAVYKLVMDHEWNIISWKLTTVRQGVHTLMTDEGLRQTSEERNKYYGIGIDTIYKDGTADFMNLKNKTDGSEKDEELSIPEQTATGKKDVAEKLKSTGAAKEGIECTKISIE